MLLKKFLLSYGATWPHPLESLAHWDTAFVSLRPLVAAKLPNFGICSNMVAFTASELCFCIGYSKLLQLYTKNPIQQLSAPSAVVQMKILEN